MSGDPNVHRKHIGKPALTDRQVIDSSYDYAISFAFDDLASHDNYQAGHAHLGFLDECGHMWHKVQVFDLEEISIAGE